MASQSAEWITAARVLRRSGFGARGADVDSLVAAGKPSTFVKGILNLDLEEDPGALATPMQNLRVPAPPETGAGSESANAKYRQTLRDQRRELIDWWLRRMVAAQYSATEKLTFLWHNHFATSVTKVGIPALLEQQNQKLRELCLGDFRTLAYAMLTDAAMISWLDGNKNKSGSPNENLAREFLEVFALGHGNGYTEKDVRDGARALTGWRINKEGQAALVAKNHDASDKMVLGTRGDLGAAEFCDAVLNAPGSAEFVTSRLWQQLVSDLPPSAQTRERLVAAYGPERNLRALTVAVLTDPSFLNRDTSVVVGPLEWLVGLLRAFQVTIDQREQSTRIVAALKSLGQLPFHPPSVGGWPQGRAWLSTSSAGIRLRMALRIAKDGNLSAVTDSPVADRIDAVGYLIGVGSWSDRTVDALKPLRKDPPALVAAAANTPEYLTS